MKKIISTSTIIFLALISFAQEKDTTYWNNTGSFGLNFSEVSFTNWAAGGKNSISGVGLFNFSANYLKDKINWENTFNFNFGLLKEGKNEIAKTEDKIEISSKLGIKSNSEKLFYSALFDFRSQFANGYNYPDTDNKISAFFAPAYLNTGIGIDYKPSKKFSAALLPLSGKITIVGDKILSDAGAFGVDPGSKTRTEFGATFKAQLKTPVVENVSIDTQLSLFSNYLDTPQNIDIIWDFALNMKINDFLSANFLTNLIYDDDIKIAVDDNSDGVTDSEGPRIQFKQLLGVGFSYNF